MSKDAKYPSRTADQFVVRLPDGMRDRIAEAAKSNNRSMNAEIVARLQDSFAPPKPDSVLFAARQSGTAYCNIYLAIDTNGMPISWDEISEYIRLVRNTADTEILVMNTEVVTPELMSSRARATQARAVREKINELIEQEKDRSET